MNQIICLTVIFSLLSLSACTSKSVKSNTPAHHQGRLES